MLEPRNSSDSTRHDIDEAEERLLPYYKSPFAANSEIETHHLRRSSNSIELFFDLFLAADLATFTEGHSIVNKNSLIAFVGFFTIAWSTWFQITLHDVRFAQDSIYERACKFLQFLLFVAFALVGAEFQPLAATTNSDLASDGLFDNTINLWLLSFTLCSSRLLLAAQYLVVFFSRRRPDRLRTPLLLHVSVLLASASIFAGLTSLFANDSTLRLRGSSLGYVTWYLLLVFEVISILCITTVWKGLNFTKTHLAERMGLLTFIMIGEGAIGAANTTIDVMKDRSLSAEPIFLIICIVLILVFLWTLYFKDLPSTPYGSLSQLAWSCLHLPLHLSLVGVLEATRQITVIRYVDQALSTFVQEVNKICLHDHLNGQQLGDKVLKLIDNYEYGMMHSTAEQSTRIQEVVQSIAETPDICSAANTQGLNDMFDSGTNINSAAFEELLFKFANSLSISNDPENFTIPEDQDSFSFMQKSVRSVYLYYWSFAFVMLLSFIMLYWLIVRRKSFTTTWGLSTRSAVVALAIVFLGLYSQSAAWTSFFASVAMLPTLCVMLAFVVVMDRLAMYLRTKKTVALETYPETKRKSWSANSKENLHSS